MNLLVTGASGSLGRNILPSLSTYFANIYELSSSNNEVLSSSKAIFANLCDLDLELKLDRTISNNKIDLIIHMAANLSTRNVIEDWSQNITANIFGTHRLIQWAVKRGIKHFFFTSSYIHLNKDEQPFTIHSTFRPNSPYGVSKLVNELEIINICKQYNVRFVILRIPSFYGPYYFRYWTVLPKMIKSAILNQCIEIYGTGSRTMNFIHTSDIVSAIVKSVESDKGGIFHLGSERPVTMSELAEIIKRHIPNTKIIKNATIDPQEGQKFDVDISETIKVLNWRPLIDISEGITDAIRAVKNSLGVPQ